VCRPGRPPAPTHRAGRGRPAGREVGSPCDRTAAARRPRDYRRPPQQRQFARRLFGKLFDDHGYISQPLAEQVWVRYGLRLITKVRRNMRERLLAYTDKLLLRKRARSSRAGTASSRTSASKNICQIERSRHRSPYNFLAHLLAGLTANCHQPKKPSLHLARDHDLSAVG
jgi:hypothetical protein